MSLFRNIFIKNKRVIIKDDESWAVDIAAKYGMKKEYYWARKEGLTPIEALEEWDLI